MESFGECRGCNRNIKYAVKQARLCRTCYNKTYLTSQKRREYYKNKKRRRETAPQHQVDSAPHVATSTASSSSSSSIQSTSTRHIEADRQYAHHDPQAIVAAAQYYLLNGGFNPQHLLQSNGLTADCIPGTNPTSALGGMSHASSALSLAALAQASHLHSALEGAPSSPVLSSSTANSPPSSPSSSAAGLPSQGSQHHQPVRRRQAQRPSSPSSLTSGSTASSSPTSTPYGSPPTATALLQQAAIQELLQQAAALPAYYAALAPMLGLNLAAQTPPAAQQIPAAPVHLSPFASPIGGSAYLPPLTSFLAPAAATFVPGNMTGPITSSYASMPVLIPSARYPPQAATSQAPSSGTSTTPGGLSLLSSCVEAMASRSADGQTEAAARCTQCRAPAATSRLCGSCQVRSSSKPRACGEPADAPSSPTEAMALKNILN